MPSERSEKRRRQNQVACQMCRAKKLKCDLRQPCSNCLARYRTCEYAGRQDAIACQMCRSRKIKCDRSEPCSNCALRKWTCEYTSNCRETKLNWNTLNGGNCEPSDLSIALRLSELEQAVFGHRPGGHPSNCPNEEDRTSQTTPWPEPDRQQDVASSRWLESICGGLTEISTQLSGNLCLEFKTTNQLALDFSHLRQTKKISLPPRDFAFRILDLYEESLESAQQIMHVPTLRARVQHVYEQVPGQDASSQCGIVALLLALSAQAGYWSTYEGHGMFHSVDEAVRVSTVLAQQAMDALEHARALTIVNTETIQATVLLIFHFHYIEGFSARTRALHSVALTMARELNLHRIDELQRNPSSVAQESVVEIETARKLWWYIASTDWILAFHSGPTEGVYSVIPQQMSVKKPRNLDAKDLLIQSPDFEWSSDEATKMAYYFFRIKLAEICRDAVDSKLMQDPEAVPYERVSELDARFAALSAGLPRFLQLNVASERIKFEFGDRHGSQFGLQRALANLMISVRRCKMHLPFLIRCRTNPKYTFSRAACLVSARRLLEVYRVFLDDSSWHLSSFLQVLSIYNFVFYATIVLVMDLCTNNPHDRAQRLEVREALKIVADAESTNRTASKLLEALRHVLNRHGISLSAGPQSGLTLARQPHPEDARLVPQEPSAGSRPQTDPPSSPTFDFSDIEPLWTDNLADDQFLDPRCWDELLNLDMRII